jgi:excisionase family DNA binding protein
MTPATMPIVLHTTDPAYTLERYSVPQAAAYLLVSVSRVYADASAGRLAHRKDGNRRLHFSQADLDAWRAPRRVEVRDRPRLIAAKSAPPAGRLQDLPLPKTLRFNH